MNQSELRAKQSWNRLSKKIVFRERKDAYLKGYKDGYDDNDVDLINMGMIDSYFYNVTLFYWIIVIVH
jgi:hypothetical protein